MAFVSRRRYRGAIRGCYVFFSSSSRGEYFDCMSDINFKQTIALRLFYGTSVLVSTNKQEDPIQQPRTLSPKLAIHGRCMALTNDPECRTLEVTTPLGALR